MRMMLKAVLPAIALMVLLNGCQALTGETFGQNIDDTSITTSVKSKLAADKGSSLTRVQVDTNQGVVQLSGTVETAADRNRAEQVAREASGVKSVKNNLQVQKK
jgi:hyperosmotically inducible protein